MAIEFIDFKQPENFVAVDEREYILTGPYTVQWRKGDKSPVDFRIVVPPYMNTDFATTPKWGKLLGFGHDGPWRAAAVVHDFMYMVQGFKRFRDISDGAYQVKTDDTIGYQNGVSHWDRKECDDLFLQLMKEGGTSWWRRSVMYRAVRMFGKKYWDS